VKRSET
jgi:enoyl-[acyl-carrier protein] reductase I